MLDQWKKRQKRGGNIPNNNLLTMGEEWYVARSGFIGVCCAEIGERGVVQHINKQLTKAYTEQT